MRTFSINKFIVSFVILITIVFLFPLFIGGFSGNTIVQLFTDASNGFSSSLLRSFSFALSSAIINVLIGFYLALFLSKIPLKSKLGKLLSFFIIPITLGNVAIIFVFKVLLFNSTFFNTIVEGGAATQFLLLIFIQFWQYGFLFTYLFWLNIQNSSRRINDYSIAIGLSKFEKVRDIILPQIKNLSIILFFLGFIFSFYEDAKSQFILKASQGLKTELVNHWLYRTYQSNLLINTSYATQSVFKTGLVIFIITLISFLFIAAIAFISFRFISKVKSHKKENSKKNETKSQVLFPALILLFGILLITLPIIGALLKSQFHFSEDIYLIGFPFLLTLLAAFASTVFAVLFGIASRLLFRKWLSSLNSKSVFYFLGIFLLQLLPPLIIVLCGFKWLSWIGYNSETVIYFVWILGHCFLTFPLLGSFVVATHFAVKENEINYLSASKISIGKVYEYSFLKRFKAEYIFTLLFAFTFIWNDTGLNMILSDRIPSFAAILQMLFIGRAADYSKATIFVLVAILLAISCLFIWQYIIDKSIKNNQK